MSGPLPVRLGATVSLRACPTPIARPHAPLDSSVPPPQRSQLPIPVRVVFSALRMVCPLQPALDHATPDGIRLVTAHPVLMTVVQVVSCRLNLSKSISMRRWLAVLSKEFISSQTGDSWFQGSRWLERAHADNPNPMRCWSVLRGGLRNPLRAWHFQQRCCSLCMFSLFSWNFCSGCWHVTLLHVHAGLDRSWFWRNCLSVVRARTVCQLLRSYGVRILPYRIGCG